MVWLISKMKIYILHYICHMKFKSPCRTACRQTISENSSMSKNQPCMFSPHSDTAPLWNKWSRRSFTGSVLPNCTANILSLQQLSLWGQASLPFPQSRGTLSGSSLGLAGCRPFLQFILCYSQSHRHSQGRQVNKRKLSLWSWFYF